METTLVLGSSSPQRLKLLHSANILPDIVEGADIQEIQRPKETARTFSQRMAIEKAMSLSSKYPHFWILSGDTVVCRGTQILQKPEDAATAYHYLSLLSGRRHLVTSSIALISPKFRKPKIRSVTTRIKFKTLTEQEKKEYVLTEEWKGKSGGYALQGRAAAFILWLNGSYTSVIGLPLPETLAMLYGSGWLNGRNKEPVKTET